VQLVSEFLPVLHGAKNVQYLLVVRNIVPHVIAGRLKHRPQPYASDAQVSKVIDPVDDAAQVTYAVAVRVLEAPWIYLIEYTLFPPTPFELHALHLTLV